ncbi:uncharacterized protein LOC126901659 isoform X2 [Daktulosphaira vitifoliae]|uniref:uncharacterized protein LOC126901659 isoform X2 n=1 Tax=Daktulosphaira vitifoliae TaxID=58002 RepID=UPI0021AA3D28|nr:uncharacterized protein LOC126901659 isoform X2 [Daktulosphaira vitifoliae]
MPFYSVIFRKNNTGAITDCWKVAEFWRDSNPNSFAKKFYSFEQCENFIKELGFTIMYNFENLIDEDNSKKIEINKCLSEVLNSFTDLTKYVQENIPKNSENLKILKNIQEATMSNLNKFVINIQTPAGYINSNGSNQILVPLAETNKQENISINQSENMNLEKDLFLYDFDENVLIYIDGVVTINEFKKASAGAGVFFNNDHHLNLSVKIPGSQTLNNAKIYAAILALDTAYNVDIKKLCIHTNSKFLFSCVDSWIIRWKANGWITNSKTQVKNKEMLTILDSKIKKFRSIKWKLSLGEIIDELPYIDGAQKLAKDATLPKFKNY